MKQAALRTAIISEWEAHGGTAPQVAGRLGVSESYAAYVLRFHRVTPAEAIRADHDKHLESIAKAHGHGFPILRRAA